MKLKSKAKEIKRSVFYKLKMCISVQKLQTLMYGTLKLRNP